MSADWALIKGYKLLYPNTSTSDKDILHHCKNYPPYQHLGEYIEQHEEAPLCPYLKRAREIYASTITLRVVAEAVIAGKHDQDNIMPVLIQALKETV